MGVGISSGGGGISSGGGDGEDEWGRSEGSRSVVMMGGVGFGGSRTEELMRMGQEQASGALNDGLNYVSETSSAAVGLVGASVKESTR